MQSRKVSLLTPMYNTAGYVHRLLDSVLGQDYPDIEMIVIDDGSTDGSRQVVESYISRFAAKGYVLRYEYQANSGQSVAVKRGLPLVTGTYLAWPDSDDYYSSDRAISKMVSALESAPEEFQMVRTQVIHVEDGTLRHLQTDGLDAHEEEPRSLFEDCLFGRNGFYYCAGSYLVRTAVLRELTDFDIYTEKNAGQNWQLTVPVLHKYRCRTIMEPLFTVVERAASHTRGQYDGYEQSLIRYNAYVNTQTETLKRLKGFPPQLIPDYSRQILEYNDRRRFEVALRENNRRAALSKLPACKAEMGSGGYRLTGAILHLPGGTFLINAYRSLHHALHLLKKRFAHVQ